MMPYQQHELDIKETAYSLMKAGKWNTESFKELKEEAQMDVFTFKKLVRKAALRMQINQAEDLDELKEILIEELT